MYYGFYPNIILLREIYMHFWQKIWYQWSIIKQDDNAQFLIFLLHIHKSSLGTVGYKGKNIIYNNKNDSEGYENNIHYKEVDILPQGKVSLVMKEYIESKGWKYLDVFLISYVPFLSIWYESCF